LDNSSERWVAKDEMVEGDIAVEPARYHFLIVSTTLAFSITYFESSFPSKDTTICIQQTTKPLVNLNAIFVNIS